MSATDSLILWAAVMSFFVRLKLGRVRHFHS